MSLPTVPEIADALEKEGYNLGAANRKADSILIMQSVLLVNVIRQLRQANETLEKILDKDD